MGQPEETRKEKQFAGLFYLPDESSTDDAGDFYLFDDIDRDERETYPIQIQNHVFRNDPLRLLYTEKDVEERAEKDAEDMEHWRYFADLAGVDFDEEAYRDAVTAEPATSIEDFPALEKMQKPESIVDRTWKGRVAFIAGGVGSGVFWGQAGWNLDFAQLFDIVGWPLPPFLIGNTSVLSEHWFAVGAAFYMGSIALAKKGAEINAEESGYREAELAWEKADEEQRYTWMQDVVDRIDIDVDQDALTELEPEERDEDLAEKYEQWREETSGLSSDSRYGTALSIAGLAATTGSYVAQKFFGVEEIAGWHYGQIWNFAFYAGGLTGLFLISSAGHIQGVGNGVARFEADKLAEYDVVKDPDDVYEEIRG